MENDDDGELEMFSFLAQHLLTLKANIIKPSEVEGILPEEIELDFFLDIAITSMAYLRLKACNNASDKDLNAVITKIIDKSASICRLAQAHNRKHNAH